MVIQWSNFKPSGQTLTTVSGFRGNFQIRLNEADNSIEVVYGPCSPGVGTTITTGYQVGLRGPNNTFPTNVNNRTVVKGTNDWATSSPGTSNASTCVYNDVAPSNVIPSGLTYRWDVAPALNVAAGTVIRTSTGCFGATESLSARITNAGTGRIDVFEAAWQLGGRARSVSAHGRRLDNGQHILVGAYRETLRLIQAVGNDPDRLLKRMPLEIAFPGRQPAPFRLRLPRLPAPWHLAVGLLGTRGASLAEKLRAVRFMRFLQATDYRLGDDCTVAALLDRHAQHGNLRHCLWEPLCLAALNTAPEQASAQIFVNTLRDSLGSDRAATDLLLPAADLDQLFPAAAASFIAQINYRYGCSHSPHAGCYHNWLWER